MTTTQSTRSRRATANPRLDVDALIADRDTKIIICCGSGGVGKTTTSAALAVRAAEAGRKAVVLTIDPARRLAQSLGLGALDNTPRPVAGVDSSAGGSLDAMMLDMKRTFDDVVLAHASADKAEAILSNPFYQALSTSFSGTQEYMAMEKLGQLHTQAEADGRWDLIVVDTPPARSALDFLDAPEHLSDLLDGRFLRTLLAPARGPLKLMSVGFNLVYSAMNKVLGAQIITDVKTFVTAFETLFGGFRARAQQTHAILSSAHTTFVVVATAERDALREAAFFVDRLTDEGMPLSGMVINRVHRHHLAVSAERSLTLAEQITEQRAEPVADGSDDGRGRSDRTRRGAENHDHHQHTDDHDHDIDAEIAALGLHAARMRVIEREQTLLTRFARSRRQLSITQIPALPSDVSDLASLRDLGSLLAEQDVAP